MLHVGGANIESVTGELSNLETAAQEGLKSGKFLFDESTVLYSKIRPYLMKVVRPPFRGLCSADIYPLSPDTGVLSRDYLYYILLSEDFTDFAVAGSARAGMPKVNRDHLFSYPLSLPPLPEQRRVVGILDKSFEGIAIAKMKAERSVENAREMIASYVESVFSGGGEGWRLERLRHLSRIDYGYTESASVEKVGPRFLRITDIQMSRVDWSAVPYCRVGARDFPRYRLEDGDIVFARTGATTGKSFLVTEPPEAVFASYLIRVRLNTPRVSAEFLDVYFRSNAYWEKIRSGVSGSAQGGFNATKLGELEIPFPGAAEEQAQIVANCNGLAEEAERLSNVFQRRLAALAALKTSLLHHAFAGHL